MEEMIMYEQISFPENPPKLIMIVGPCRTGTTALANNFVKAGITSYMQPIKSMRRALELGGEIAPWNIKQEDYAITKETIGVDTPADFFDPVQILLDLGYPKEKLVLIPIIRDPRQTYVSWKCLWGKADLQKFIQSYELILQIKNKAEHIGIKTIPYVHEVIRDNSVGAVVTKLFQELSLSINQRNTTDGWGAFKNGGDHLRFYDDPPERFIAEIQRREAYEYQDRLFAEDDARLIANNPILSEIYDSFRKACEKALGFDTKAI